jgi:hypothetical protein
MNQPLPEALTEALARYVRERWTELPVGTARPAHLQYLVQASGVTKIVVYLFADRARVPVLVAKLARRTNQQSRLLAEAESITRLRHLLPEHLAATLPGPIHVAYIADVLVTLEPGLDGAPLDVRIPVGREPPAVLVNDVLGRALTWLIALQRVVSDATEPPDVETRRRILVEPIHLARQHAHLLQPELDYLQALEARVLQLAGELPLLVYHGDFRAGNVLSRATGIHVLDWEFMRPLSAPLLDWFSFAFRLYCRTLAVPDIDGHLRGYVQAFRGAFLEDTPFSRCLAETVRLYCGELQVPGDSAAALLGLFLIDNINKFARFQAERAGTDHLYLMRDFPAPVPTFGAQLRRQAYVWLLGELASRTTVVFS